MLVDFKAWLQARLPMLSAKSDTTKAINYALNQWQALVLYCDHGIAKVDNNAAECALRSVALGRKNFLFRGADSGSERAASMYALIGTAKLNGIDPEAYLRHVLTHIADQSHQRSATLECRHWICRHLNLSATCSGVSRNQNIGHAPLTIDLQLRCGAAPPHPLLSMQRFPQLDEYEVP